MKNGIIVFTLVLIHSCSPKLVPTRLVDNQGIERVSTAKIKEMKSLNSTVELIVNAGGNHNRRKAVSKRIEEFQLLNNTTLERIDWLSSQKNVLIEIEGEKKKYVYIVAHYDKTDINPLKFLSLMLNGLLDPLVSWTYASDGAIDNQSELHYQ